MEIFYAAPDKVCGNRIQLGLPETRHLVRVLRHRPGDQILVVDGQGNEYRCCITEITRQATVCEVINRTRRAREPIVEITLAPAIIKGNRLDLVVEMATELGVSRIVPLRTARTVAALTSVRQRRFQNLAIAALKSSTRTVLPVIGGPVDFEEFVRNCGRFDLKLMAYEEEPREHQLRGIAVSRVSRAVLLIGPEGGFTSAEVMLARQNGFQTFSLGPRRLRAETACIAGLAVLLYQLQEL